MHIYSALISLAWLAISAVADTHILVAGTFSFPSLTEIILTAGQQRKLTRRLLVSTGFLYFLEYTDDNPEIRQIDTVRTSAASSWITLSHDGRHIYGTDWNADEPTFVSYGLSYDNRSASWEGKVVVGSSCSGGVKSIFVLANPYYPYTVYGNYYYGDPKCSTIMSTGESGGKLEGVVEDYIYSEGSGVHGTAFSPSGAFLFSADTYGNRIWTHEVDPMTGKLTHASSTVDGPSPGSDPRHLAVHKKGKYVYAVLEGSSEVAQYELGEGGKLTYTNETYSLLPEGRSPADYWGDEVAVTVSHRYLWASTRSHEVANPGYVSGFSLAEDDGKMEKRLFLKATKTSGGFANSIAPSLHDDRKFALTDNATGLVQVWEATAGFDDVALAAEIQIDDGGGCCANAVWLT
ncbi:carboxy-cis,cis-muconate cyclase [Xylariomycetidae sp. FL2044]|nr:carboxy-cis,cis-muconate cyclase [Xylariomycetidae sp. FL2044]